MSRSVPDELRTSLRSLRTRAARLLAEPDAGATAARTRFLTDVGHLLDTTLDQRATLDGIVGLSVPEMAELAILDLVDDDGRLLGSGVARSADPALAEQLLELRATSPLDPAGRHPIAIAARTGTVQFIRDVTHEHLRSFAADDAHFRGMSALGYSSAIAAPLIARGRIRGVLTLLHFGELRYDAEDVQTVSEVAGRAALALDNARLFAELGEARAQQEAILAAIGQSVTAQDRDGRLLFANQAAASILGAASPAELLTWTPEDFSSRFTVTDEHGRPIALEDYPGYRLFHGLEPEPLLVRSVEHSSGRILWSQVSASAVRDEDGEVVMTVTVSDDVTAVKGAEAAQRFLASASKLLGSSLDVETTLSRAAATAVPQLADWCRVDLLDEHERLIPAALAHPEDAPDEHVRLARGAARLDRSDPRSPWHVIDGGRPIVINDIPGMLRESGLGDERQVALANTLDLRSIAIVPMTAGERTVGILTLATGASGRRIGAPEVTLAMELGRRAGIAVDHARVHATSRYIAETLQHSLLPRRLPDIPGTTMAPRFRAAGEGAEVGGDFYDAFPALGGWMVVMGDVAGKGPAAAAVTAQARDTMRTAAAYEDGPAAVLARLNATLTEGEHGALCSALAVLLRPPAGDGSIRATVSCAGHPRPYVLNEEGAELVGEYGSLLGAFDEGDWPQVERTLRVGDGLVLYTDGVTDARGPEDRFGRERLAALLRECAGDPADVVAARVDDAVAAFEEGPQLDDLAVLVVRVGPS